MQLVLISGLSGSGKSIALNALEDSGYYCVDNLPGQLLQQSAELLRGAGHNHVAMSIDARMGDSLELVPEYVAALKAQGVDLRLLFLDAKNDTLIRRFSETRRRHPLATGTRTLEEDRKSTRLNSSHGYISYAVFCLKKKKEKRTDPSRQRQGTRRGTRHTERLR